MSEKPKDTGKQKEAIKGLLRKAQKGSDRYAMILQYLTQQHGDLVQEVLAESAPAAHEEHKPEEKKQE